MDQALSRLVKAGTLARVARGVYVKPVQSRYVGAVLPEPAKVVSVLAATTGETVEVHGAEAARRFGLTTQMPMKPLFWTTGASRRVRVGQQEVLLKHVAPRKLALAGRPAGAALAALWHLGRGQVTAQTFAMLKRRLPPAEFQVLIGRVDVMPAWMAAAVREHQRVTGNG